MSLSDSTNLLMRPIELVALTGERVAQLAAGVLWGYTGPALADRGKVARGRDRRRKLAGLGGGRVRGHRTGQARRRLLGYRGLLVRLGVRVTLLVLARPVVAVRRWFLVGSSRSRSGSCRDRRRRVRTRHVHVVLLVLLELLLLLLVVRLVRLLLMLMLLLMLEVVELRLLVLGLRGGRGRRGYRLAVVVGRPIRSQGWAARHHWCQWHR